MTRTFNLGKSVLLRFVGVIVVAGVVSVVIADRLIAPPLERYYEDQVTSALRLASKLALDECDRSLDHLLEMRLVDEPRMVATMRNDTLKRIEAISRHFPGMKIAVVEMGSLLPETATDVTDELLSAVIAQSPMEEPVQVGEDATYLVHSRYFPFWRWHVVALLEHEMALAPIVAAERLVRRELIAIVVVLVFVAVLMFSSNIRKPLLALVQGARSVAGGNMTTVPVQRDDEVGYVTQIFNSMVESLDAQRQINEQTMDNLKAVARHREVLLREVHHRVRNNLNVIISLLNLRSATLVNTNDARHAFEDSKNRVRAMALIHSHLYESSSLGLVEMETYIPELAQEIQQLYAPERERVFTFDLSPLSIDLYRAAPLGLIINESITNSFKHAWPEGNPGHISIGMRLVGDRCSLEIRDDGRGFVRGDVVSSSLGVILIEQLTEQIDGTVTFAHNGGTVVTLEFPHSALGDDDIRASSWSGETTRT